MPKFKEGDMVAPIKGIRGDGWYGVICTVVSWSWCPACGKISVAVTGEVNMMSVHVDKADLREVVLKF